jgi:hypothetical protein
VKPIILNKVDVLTAAKKAWEEQRLGCQDRSLIDKGCRYHYPNGKVCAIGAALPDEVAKEFDLDTHSQPIDWLLAEGKVVSDDKKFLLRLQRAYDDATNTPTRLHGLRTLMLLLGIAGLPSHG